jgi:pimeloyl-ACP methyl ester carboxylesterase
MNPLALLQHQDALRNQCSPPPQPPEGEQPPINVTTWGASGEPVLIIHGGVQGGLGGGPLTFANQRPLADQGFQLRLADRPGFGASQSRGPDDMVADAVWIAELLADSSHLLGHSWGGAEALLAAARRPDAVRSLVLVEPALHPFLIAAPDTPELAAAKADAAFNIAKLLDSRTPAEYGLAFVRSLGGAENDSTALLQSLKVDPARATNLGCALLRGRMAPPPALYQAAAAVKDAGIPVLVISGGWSRVFDGLSKVTAQLTGGAHKVVRSEDHFPQLSSPGAFNNAVSAFWRTTSTFSK